MHVSKENYFFVPAKSHGASVAVQNAKHLFMNKRLLTGGLLLLHLPLFSTAQLFVGTSGNDLYIAQGSSVIYDGFKMTAPAGGLGLSGTELNRLSQSVGSNSGPSSIVRTYAFNPAATLSGTLDIFYDDGELNGNTESQLEMAFGNAGNWQTATGSAVSVSNNVVTYTVNNVTMSNVTAVTAGTPLSLIENSFAARMTDKGVLASWEVSNSHKYQHFDVQRSENGYAWNSAGKVNALSSAGRQNYSLLDADVAFKLRYYRLKMTGADGLISYSTTVALRRDQQSSVQLASRSGGFQIRFDGWQPTAVQLIDAQGRVLRSAKDCTVWEESGLTPGFYLIRISNGTTTSVQKIAIR